MPKRKKNHKESREERWRRKLQKYEGRLEHRIRSTVTAVVYPTDDEDIQVQDILPESSQYPVDNPVENPIESQSVEGSQTEIPPLPPPSSGEPNSGSQPVETQILENGITTEIRPEQNNNNEDLFDTELLNILGDFEVTSEEWGDDLQEGVSKRFQQILQEGLKKEVKEELNKKYLFPKNTPFCKAPTLNPEINTMQAMTESFKQRDKHMMSKQNQLGKALSVLGGALTAVLKKNPNISDVVRILNDCGKLIADSHYMETYTRRSMVIPLLDKSLVEPFKERKRDQFLFGDNLMDIVKTSNTMKKTGTMIQSQNTPTTSGLNFQGPPLRGRQRYYQSTPYTRTGVQRGQHMNSGRRRGHPLPAQLPQTRRPLQPPPPPLRRQQAQAMTTRYRSQNEHVRR
ncbi:uncharacterized protein LOC125488559 [Plutella xylostella]|uniref:uncharacterized protein LOC125488559 n=1 Tax=Plutella xylostella TaxID=51655 RepID=UPI0020329868|nr:uncharacterized protein LOC125488559 [Plutella xylostella]